MSSTAWLVVAFLIVALAIGGYVLSVIGRTKKLEGRLRTLRDRAHYRTNFGARKRVDF